MKCNIHYNIYYFSVFYKKLKTLFYEITIFIGNILAEKQKCKIIKTLLDLSK